MRVMMQLDEKSREDFIGGAYTAQPLIDFLVRRWRRQALRAVWYSITATSMRAFYPSDLWEWFRWRSESGALNSKLPESPQSWTALLEEVDAVDTSSLPPILRQKPAFAILFVLVYPHRFTRELSKLIEDTIASTR